MKRKKALLAILTAAVTLSGVPATAMTAMAAPAKTVKNVQGLKVTKNDKTRKLTVSWKKTKKNVQVQVYLKAGNAKYKQAGTTSKTSFTTKKLKTNVKYKVKVRVKSGKRYSSFKTYKDTFTFTAKKDDNKQVTLTKQQKINHAKALINTFATGDTKTARSLLADGYIQHNLSYGTGADAFVSSVEYLAAQPTKTTVNNIRAFADGDKVFLQTVYNFAGAGEQVGFDIFRFDDNGKIAEHWDNLANVAAPNPSGHTQIDGTTTVTDEDKTEANRSLVSNFLVDVMMNQHPEKTASYFDGNTYIQHNIAIADGLDGLSNALTGLANAGGSMIYNKVHMVLADGNFVLGVSEGTYNDGTSGDVPTAYYDLWRVENGKITEHWDVMQTIPDQSTWANQNGKF